MIDSTHVFFEGAEGETTVATASSSAIQRLDVPGLPRPEFSAIEEFSPLIQLILRGSELKPEWYQPKALNRRLPACLRQLRVQSESAAIEKVTAQPKLAGQLLSSVLIGVTDFFRDREVFDHLWKISLPRIAAEEGAMSVCSIGCSAGHEIYSIAMILHHMGMLANSHLMGVDCRPDAVQQAKLGEYSTAELQKLDPQFRNRYFEICGAQARISTEIRSCVHWRVGGFEDAAADRFWNVVLFRNVAIYLRPQKAVSVWQNLHKQLKPGGLLVTGRAERPPRELNYVQEHVSIYAKRKD